LVKFLGAHHITPAQAFRSVKLRLGEHQGRLALLPRGCARPHERDLIVHVFNRMDELEALAARLRHQTSHSGLGRDEVRLGGIDSRLFDRDLHAKWLGVEFY
jgi:hypothetical protein